MSVIFGDFVFKITAPIKNALRNLQMWDKQAEKSTKTTKDNSKEQTSILDSLGKAWDAFGGIMKTAFLGIAAAVMRWSPHIRAHLSIIGLHMRMIARDIGKTWAPAFKLAKNVVKEASKTWREWGKGTKAMTEEQKKAPAKGILGALGFTEEDVANFKKRVHDFVNIGLGVGALIATFSLLGKAVSFIFGDGIIVTAISATTKFIGGLLAGISTTVAAVIAVIVALLIAGYIAWKENFLGMRDAVSGWWEGIKQMFSGVWEMLKGFWDMIAGLFTGDTERFLEGARKVWNGFVNFVKGWGKAMLNSYRIVATAVLRLLKGLWDGIMWLFETGNEVVGNIMHVLLEVFSKIWNKIKELAGLAIESIRDKFVGKFGDMLTYFIDFGARLINSASAIWTSIKNGFSGMAKNAFDWGADMIKNLWSGIRNMGSWIREKIYGWISDYIPIEFDTEKNDKMARRWGSDLIKHFTQGMNEQGKTVVNQKVISNLTINNSSQGQNLDVYGMASLTENLLLNQFEKIKGLGTQYY